MWLRLTRGVGWLGEVERLQIRLGGKTRGPTDVWVGWVWQVKGEIPIWVLNNRGMMLLFTEVQKEEAAAALGGNSGLRFWPLEARDAFQPSQGRCREGITAEVRLALDGRWGPLSWKLCPGDVCSSSWPPVDTFLLAFGGTPI